MVEVSKFYGKAVRIRYNVGASQKVVEGGFTPAREVGVSICVLGDEKPEVRIEDASIVEIGLKEEARA